MSKRLFIKSTLILILAGFASRIMGFFYRIFLSQTIGAQGMGIYQLLMPLQVLLMAVTTSGFQAALSRLCAAKIALKKKNLARDYLCTGTSLAFLLSMLLSVLVRRHSVFLAEQILKIPGGGSFVFLLSWSFPFSTLHSCITSYYYARKKTLTPSVIQLLEQFTRVGSTWIIYQILLSRGQPATPAIAIGGTLISEIAAVLIILFFIGTDFQKEHYRPGSAKNIPAILRDILQMSVPLSLNRILLTLLSAAEVTLIPQMLMKSGLDQGSALSVYGIFTGMALPVILFPSAVTNSVSVLLMPSIAELQALGQKKRIQDAALTICGMCLLLGILCTFLFFLLGPFAGSLLFHNSTAGTYIRTLSFTCPFLYLNVNLSGILNGLGKSGRNLLHNAAAISLRIFFVVMIIPAVGIRGYFYGLLFGELLLCVLHTLSLRSVFLRP